MTYFIYVSPTAFATAESEGGSGRGTRRLLRRAGWALDFMRKTARSGRAELRALARESLEKLAA